MGDLNPDSRVRRRPIREVRHGHRKGYDEGHAHRISVLNELARTHPDEIDPIGQLPGNMLTGFNDLGEEFTVPRKLWPDTFMTTACILPGTKLEIDHAGKLGRPVAGIAQQNRQMMGRLPHRGN